MTDARATAPPPWLLAYLAAASGLFAFAVGYVVNGRRSGDVYLHASVVGRLADDPWSPANPLTGTDLPDVGFSPYTLALGLFARTTGWSPFDVVDLVGLVLVVAFLALFPAAVEVLTGDRRAAPLALLLVVVAWGVQAPWRWSGQLHLNAFGFMIGYPAMAAWCALLGAVVAAARAARGHRLVPWAALAALLWFITLSHPLTLVGAVPLVIGVAVRDGGRRAVPPLLITGASVAATALLWPYWSLFDLLSAGDAYDAVHQLLYRQVPGRVVLAVPGLVALGWLCVRRPRTFSPLAATAAVAVGLFLLGDVASRPTAGRALPFALFAGSLALAALGAELLVRGRGAQRRLTLAAVGGIVVVGTAAVSPGLLGAVPRDLLATSLRNDARLQSEVHRFDGFAAHLDDGALVAATDLTARKGSTVHGSAAVAPGFPSPHIDDMDVRLADASVAIHGDEAARRDVWERRDVTHVLVTEGTVLGWSEGPVATSGGYDLHRVG